MLRRQVPQTYCLSSAIDSELYTSSTGHLLVAFPFALCAFYSFLSELHVGREIRAYYPGMPADAVE